MTLNSSLEYNERIPEQQKNKQYFKSVDQLVICEQP